MLNWIRRRRLSADARRRLMILAARSEEALIATHVTNAIELLEALDDEVDLDRGIDLYEETMGLPPALADAVKTRVLARLDARSPVGAEYPGVLAETASSHRRPRRRPR